jgi:hypothetical protein
VIGMTTITFNHGSNKVITGWDHRVNSFYLKIFLIGQAGTESLLVSESAGRGNQYGPTAGDILSILDAWRVPAPVELLGLLRNHQNTTSNTAIHLVLE